MNEDRRGILFGVAAYGIWGLFPLYFPLLEPAGAGEILAHRCLWSLVAVALVLAIRRQWAWVRPALADRRRLGLLALAAVLLALNWGVYIYGVNSHHVVETALGYFINPLITVMLGVVVLRERLSPSGWIAVGLAGCAVAVLTISYGRLPYIALILAFSFAGYGFLKKRVGAAALEGLTVETAVLALPALLVIVVLAAVGRGHVRPRGWTQHLAGQRRGGHGRPAGALRRRGHARLADDDGAAAVPHADAAIPGRRPGPARTVARRPARRLHPDLGGADRLLVRWRP